MLDFIKSMISAIKSWVKREIVTSTADWDENNSSKTNHIKNRTHYDARERHDVRLTFNGNLEGMECVPHPIFGGTYVKISDLAPTAEELIGGKVILKIGDEIIYDEIQEVLEPGPGIRVYTGSTEAVFLDAPYTETNLTLSAGTWFLFLDQDDIATYITELSYTATSGELKKLDSKYMPDNVVTVDTSDGVQRKLKIEAGTGPVSGHIVLAENGYLALDGNGYQQINNIAHLSLALGTLDVGQSTTQKVLVFSEYIAGRRLCQISISDTSSQTSISTIIFDTWSFVSGYSTLSSGLFSIYDGTTEKIFSISFKSPISYTYPQSSITFTIRRIV